jgi:hypothetical protein
LQEKIDTLNLIVINCKTHHSKNYDNLLRSLGRSRSVERVIDDVGRRTMDDEVSTFKKTIKGLKSQIQDWKKNHGSQLREIRLL